MCFACVISWVVSLITFAAKNGVWNIISGLLCIVAWKSGREGDRQIFGRESDFDKVRVRVRKTEWEGNLMMTLSLLIGGISLTFIGCLLQQPLIHCHSHSSLSFFYCQLSLPFHSISLILFYFILFYFILFFYFFYFIYIFIYFMYLFILFILFVLF